MGTWHSSAVLSALVAVLFSLAHGEQFGLLESLPSDLLESLSGSDLLSASGLKDSGAGSSAFKKLEETFGDTLSGGGKDALKFAKDTLRKPLTSPVDVFEGAKPGSGKLLKAAAVPLKKVTLKKVAGAKLLAPKLKMAAALKVKPKVYSLEPIVHVIEKPVPVFHKVPIPKKVIVPKFYPVMKPIPVPKIIPVPFKVPVKKIIPKIVKIPKAILIPKFYPVKKPIPIGIPYPVPKFYKVPVPKPMPYKKYIPIPIKKKVPKFIPVPVKKIIKVPKPYYVPIKVPYFTASYMKTPMAVKVPDIKKLPSKPEFPGKLDLFKKPVKGLEEQLVNIIPSDGMDMFKLKDAETVKGNAKSIKL